MNSAQTLGSWIWRAFLLGTIIGGIGGTFIAGPIWRAADCSSQWNYLQRQQMQKSMSTRP